MLWRKIHHWFIPHKDTHKQAKLLSWQALIIYILIFIGLQTGLSIVGFSKPGILGISANIDQKKLIELTNLKRQEKGLTELSENESLNKAAALKAQNMFSENYWAHFAPSGKTPWDFILGSGYQFTFAGENLAKNFYSENDVVSAWLVSPSHRDNLLNSKYKDIGIAVLEGILNGQKTTLIVQMFGTTETSVSQPTFAIQGKQIAVPKNDYLNTPTLVAATSNTTFSNPLLDPYKLQRILGFSLIILMITLLMADLIVLRRREVIRIGSHHIAHMSFLTFVAASLLISSPGSIL